MLEINTTLQQTQSTIFDIFRVYWYIDVTFATEQITVIMQRLRSHLEIKLNAQSNIHLHLPLGRRYTRFIYRFTR